MGQFAVALISGYLVGSIPTAYIIVRLFTNMDIRLSGSGNVGAANAIKVTKSKTLGIFVGILDVLKGVAAFYIGLFIGDGEFIVAAAAGTAAVAGHNFSVWLGFRGGRGLATAAGFTIVWIWPAPVLWLISWGVSRKITGDTHISNVVATVFVLIFALVAKSDWLMTVTTITAGAGHIRIAAIMLCGLILLRHLEPVLAKRPRGN